MTNYFILSPGDKIQKDDEYLNVDPAHLVWVSVEPRKVGKKASTYHMVRRPVPSNPELITCIHCCAADGKYIKGSEPLIPPNVKVQLATANATISKLESTIEKLQNQISEATIAALKSNADLKTLERMSEVNSSKTAK